MKLFTRLTNKSIKFYEVGKDYLDRHEFHAEMTKCKKDNKLSPRALEMFKTFTYEVSGDFFFQIPAERDDAVARAMEDVWRYWRGFKESNVCRIHINRNFSYGESIVINLHGYGKLVYMAGYIQSIEKGIFLVVPNNVNETIKNLTEVIVGRDNDKVQLFMDNIKKNLTFMDKFNKDDLSMKSDITIKQKYSIPNNTKSYGDIPVLLVDFPKKDKDKYGGMMEYEIRNLVLSFIPDNIYDIIKSKDETPKTKTSSIIEWGLFDREYIESKDIRSKKVVKNWLESQEWWKNGYKFNWYSDTTNDGEILSESLIVTNNNDSIKSFSSTHVDKEISYSLIFDSHRMFMDNIKELGGRELDFFSKTVIEAKTNTIPKTEKGWPQKKDDIRKGFEDSKKSIVDKYISRHYINTYSFTKPPNAFGYFTSIIRNAILKSIGDYNPKPLRSGRKISINNMNSDNNGAYNI